MNDQLTEYINSISVISYDYETYTQNEIPEYYIKQPALVEQFNTLNYTAYGWLDGGNNIKNQFIINQNNYTTISALNIQSYMYPLPYLYSNNRQQLSNNLHLVFSPQNNKNISGYLSGQLILLSEETLYVSGIMYGYIIDNFINNKIYVQSNVIGKAQSIQSSDIITGKTALLTALSGTVYTTDLNSMPSAIIKDISLTNMLGRKLLSHKNPLWGKNLNIMPAEYLDKNTGEKRQSWKLLEVSNISNNTTIITGSVQNLLIYTTEKMLNSGKIVDNKLVNYPSYLYTQPKRAYQLSIDQFLMYYVIQQNDTKICLRDTPTINSQLNEQLLFGPFSTYQMTINILKQYCEINNIQIIIPDISEKLLQFDIIVFD